MLGWCSSEIEAPDVSPGVVVGDRVDLMVTVVGGGIVDGSGPDVNTCFSNVNREFYKLLRFKYSR